MVKLIQSTHITNKRKAYTLTQAVKVSIVESEKFSQVVNDSMYSKGYYNGLQVNFNKPYTEK